MVVNLRDGSPDAILAAIERLQAISDQFSEEFDQIEIGGWANVHVYLPGEVESSITPPFMEAYLVLQKQIYQLGALVKYGVADVGQLGEIDRRELQINVIVSGGSSDYLTDLTEPLKAVLNRMVGKMTGKQAAIY